MSHDILVGTSADAVVIFEASSTRVNSTCMATAFTHAFVATALGAARPRGVSPLKVAVVLSAVAVLPDVDVLAFGLGIPYEHPLGHRGLTHSLPFAAVVGMLTPWLWFREVPRLTRGWWLLALLSFLACASPGVLDALTDAGRGVGFFLPFADGRYFAPWRPLETSPVSPIAFFRLRSLGILANELLWVWLPVGLVWMAVRQARAR